MKCAVLPVTKHTLPDTFCWFSDHSCILFIGGNMNDYTYIAGIPTIDRKLATLSLVGFGPTGVESYLQWTGGRTDTTKPICPPLAGDIIFDDHKVQAKFMLHIQRQECPCYFHLLCYSSSAKYDNNTGNYQEMTLFPWWSQQPWQMTWEIQIYQHQKNSH